MRDLKLLQDCLDQIVNDRYVIGRPNGVMREEPEECWCYDECEGSGIDAIAGHCLPCRLREAIQKEKEPMFYFVSDISGEHLLRESGHWLQIDALEDYEIEELIEDGRVTEGESDDDNDEYVDPVVKFSTRQEVETFCAEQKKKESHCRPFNLEATRKGGDERQAGQ